MDGWEQDPDWWKDEDGGYDELLPLRRRVMYYKLDENHNPIPADSEEGVKWLEAQDLRIVEQIQLEEVLISTVFLVVDHRVIGVESEPILFETIVFGGSLDQYCQRYCTWDQALAGHDQVVAMVREREGL